VAVFQQTAAGHSAAEASYTSHAVIMLMMLQKSMYIARRLNLEVPNPYRHTGYADHLWHLLVRIAIFSLKVIPFEMMIDVCE
jgi:hypothetical protein